MLNTVEDRARHDVINHFGITEEDYDVDRDVYEGTLYYANRRLHHSWVHLAKQICSAIKGRSN
ncbi:hypothetical protein [Sporosarcina sp. ITBMC105]